VRRAEARLVAGRPHEHAGPVAVAPHHAPEALDHLVVVHRLLVDHPRVPVRLDVDLVLHVDSVLVGQRVHRRVVRVMGGPDGVDVVALHHLDVLQQRLERHVAAVAGGCAPGG
jgi:hypothetical protein